MTTLTYPTGCAALDAALGGGLPAGPVVEVFGAPTGAVAVALAAVASVQKDSRCAAVVDMVGALNIGDAVHAGVSVADLLTSQAPAVGGAFSAALALVTSGQVDIVALLAGDALKVADAREVSQVLRKLSSAAAYRGVGLVIVTADGGGNELKLCASVRLKVARLMACRYEAQTVKNKLALPFQRAEFGVAFGRLTA